MDDGLAKALLYVLTAVDSEPDGVPEVLFTDTEANCAALDGLERTSPAGIDAAPLFSDARAFRAAVARLKDASLCTQQQAGLRAVEGAQSLAADRLASATDEAATLQILVRVLHCRFVDEASWGACGLKKLAPLAAPVEALLKLESLSWLERSALSESLGCYLAEVRGDLPLATFYLKAALELKEKELGVDHEETAAALNALGTCYKALGMYEEAEPLLVRAGSVLTRHGSTEARLRVEHNVCALYLQRGQYAEATVRVRAALDGALRSLPADHSLVGSLKLMQVNLLAAQGRLEGVSELLAEALAIFNGTTSAAAVQQAAHGAGAELAPAAVGADRRARSVRVASAVQQAGELALAQGNLVDGEKHLLASLAMFNEQCESRHGRVIGGMVALGVALRAQARTQEAEELLRAALRASDEARLGTHPLVAAVLAGLAATEMDSGRADAAEKLLRRAAGISTEVLGAAHPATAAVLHNLAHAVDAAGRLDDAEALYRRALEADVAALGPEHVAVARTLSNLGGVLRRKGQPAEAREAFERAHALLRASLGDAHPETARALANVGCAFVDATDYDLAEEALRAALAVEEEALGPVHLETATTLVNLGGCLAAQGRADEAARLLRRAAQIFRGTLGASHAQTRTALAWLKHAEASRGGR